MRDLTKSVASSTWALSLFGAEQMAAIALPDSRGSCDSRAAVLDRVSAVAKSRLTERFQSVFSVGDDAQRGMVDLLINAARFNFSGMAKPGIDVANPLVQGFGVVTPRRDWLTDWQELRNKIDIFDLVQNVESRVNANREVALRELVDRAYGLGDFHALWAVEGLGHYFGEQALTTTDNPQRLLTDPASLGLPDKSLTMLNAGIGLAFAEELLKELRPQSPLEDFNRIVQRFVELCRANATRGYTGAALESLGLVTRTFHVKLLSGVDRCIVSTGNEELLGYFWHGVGRGTYFSRENFLPLPCCGIRWDKVADQAPHEIGRHNIIAGLAWAVTLVNMLTPEVMEKSLQRRGDQILDQEGFSNGVSSSIVMRQDTTPNAEFLEEFCRCQRHANVSRDQLWSELIERPCVKSLNEFHPKLSKHTALEEVFRFQSLDRLTQCFNEHFSMAVQ